MRNLHIIMPMAGEGSRFANAGWHTPKPLIQLKGKPLFLHAIDSVRLDDVPMKYSFIVRQNHIDENKIDHSIKEFLPHAFIYSVEKTTRGAVETCLKAEGGIDDDDAIVVMDCDLEFSSVRYKELIRESLKNNGAKGGALVTFESDSPKYSYAEIDEDGLVKRTAEKEVISNHALCGAYFFASGKEFKAVANELVNAPMEKPELYVSLLFNKLIANRSPVYIAPMELYRSYGTPEELSRYM